MQAVSPNKGVVSAHTIGPDGQAYFVHGSSGRPSEIHAVSSRGAKPRQLTAVHKPFRPVRLHPARKITYTCDGWKIEALLKTPQGKGPWPLLLMPHGGPQGQTSDTFWPQHELFLKRGWALLMPNFRGSTGARPGVPAPDPRRLGRGSGS